MTKCQGLQDFFNTSARATPRHANDGLNARFYVTLTRQRSAIAYAGLLVNPRTKSDYLHVAHYAVTSR